MEENQTNQSLSQNPTQQESQQLTQQTKQEQGQTIQQTQSQQVEDQSSVSMQIQQLLVQQQQYQQQYNQLVDYVKNTKGLPIEEVNNIKLQLDQLNALFVEWKQKLQALWYNQVQINKPTEVKKWSKNNLSFKKLAIWCGIVLVLILWWFFVTMSSLIKNPWALQWIWVDASTAKSILMAFCGLIFGSIILLMLGVIISNIYRLITVKNQSRGKNVLWLIWWLFWAAGVWIVMWVVFWKIWGIVTKVEEKEYDIVQPYLVWRVVTWWVDEFLHPYDDANIAWFWKEYKLIAPAEIAFSLRKNDFNKYINENIPSESENFKITLSCWNNSDKVLNLLVDDKWNYVEDVNWLYKFEWTCLYATTWSYTYSVNVAYDNKISKERKTESKTVKTLNFDTSVMVYKTTTNSSSSNNKMTRLTSSSNGEFELWQAPAKITVDSAQVFRDFWLWAYEVERDMDGDFISDRINQTSFDYSYKIPQVYYVTYKFPWLSDDTWYRFPVRVEQSDRPVCGINVSRFPWTTRFQISTDFVDASSAATISSYNYTIKNATTKKTETVLKDYDQEFNHTFPEKWNYIVILDYVTIDWKQWQCESEVIQLEKETFAVDYSLLAKDATTWKFREVCSSRWSWYNWCTQIDLSIIPQSYQLQIKKITPSSNTMKKVVYLDETTLLNENDIYSFDISDEWVYNLVIATSDVSRGMEEETINIKFTAKKPNIIGNMTITSSDTRRAISEGFEPLSVVLDASKTEVNVPWDEIVYFTWDFGDGEIKRNQQNWVVAHTYNFDYVKENWIFEPKVTIITKWWLTETIVWPKLNVKKWLISVELSSTSHPSRQAPTDKDVSFMAEFDGLPEKMIWDFGDGTPSVTCQWRTCTEITHSFKNAWLYSIKLSLEFDAVQQVDWTMDFKIF